VQVIIIGSGKVGFNLAQMLSAEQHDVIVIEKDEERRQNIGEYLDIQTVAGNGASPAVLLNAGIRTADMLIAVTEQDEINMVACILAKQFGVQRTVARVRNPEYTEGSQAVSYPKLGIDLIINPEQVTAREIVKLIEVPEALDVVYYAEGRIQMVEIKINDRTPVVGKKLKELNFPQPVLVACILRNNNMIVASGEDMIKQGDHVFIMVRTRDSAVLEKFIGKQLKKPENITILGAGRISYYLTELLLKKKMASVKVIEKNRPAAKVFAQRMPEALVINGDGADPELLMEENIPDTNVFVAVTADDKLNLLVSLLAKNLGVKRTITQVRRSDYAQLMEQVGIDVAVSPRLLTAEAILRFIRRGNIVSVTLLDGDKAEVLEIIVPEKAKVVNRSLKQIKLPAGTLVGAIRRQEEVIIPQGSDVIKAGDQVMVFTLPQHISLIEKYFQANGGSLTK
jgi:trk system potassium uptake protein TrkA